MSQNAIVSAAMVNRARAIPNGKSTNLLGAMAVALKRSMPKIYNNTVIARKQDTNESSIWDGAG